MGIQYAEDFRDYVNLHVPYVYERIIVADSGAAERGRDQWTVGWVPPPSRKASAGELRRRDGDEDHETEIELEVNGNELEVEVEKDGVEVEVETQDGKEYELELTKRAADGDDDKDQIGKPVWASPFVGLSLPEGWWTPVREALLSYLRLPSDLSSLTSSPSSSSSSSASKKSKKKPVLTYVSMQMESAVAGAKLRSEDHLALVRGLRKLEIDGVLGGVNLVRGNGSTEVWEERMRGIVESSVSLSFSFSSFKQTAQEVGY